MSPEGRAEETTKYAPLIRYLADRLAARLPTHINKEDLVSSGVIGLIDAIDKFEPNRGIMFKTYAEFRIRGAMLDELRRLDWVPRSVRKKSHQVEKVLQELEGELGRPASDEEAAQAMNLTVPAFLKLLDEIKGLNILDLDAFRAHNSRHGRESRDIYEILADENTPDPLKLLGLSEAAQMLGTVVDQLPEKERLVITLYYYEELTMREIGQVMGYTESRISQLHAKSLARLKARLRQYFEGRR